MSTTGIYCYHHLFWGLLSIIHNLIPTKNTEMFCIIEPRFLFPHNNEIENQLFNLSRIFSWTVEEINRMKCYLLISIEFLLSSFLPFNCSKKVILMPGPFRPGKGKKITYGNNNVSSTQPTRTAVNHLQHPGANSHRRKRQRTSLPRPTLWALL